MLEQYRACGQTQASFAATHGIGLSTLRYWLGRERREGSEGEPAGFAEVRVRAERIIVPTLALVVRVPGGIEVQVPAGAMEAGTARFLRELAGAC